MASRALPSNGFGCMTYKCAAERLRESGHRITQQRAHLLSLLAASHERGEHLDAETLHKRALADGIDISLATVYRTLALFKELGLVSQHHFAHVADRDVYEAATSPTHHHFTCLRCGAVIEFEAPEAHKVWQALSEQLGIELNQARLYLEGLCADCRSQVITDARQSTAPSHA